MKISYFSSFDDPAVSFRIVVVVVVYETLVRSWPVVDYKFFVYFGTKYYRLAGRTMDFTFDVTKTPVIGKRWLKRPIDEEKAPGSPPPPPPPPRRSLSLSPADNNAISGWKRPWMSQVLLFYNNQPTSLYSPIVRAVCTN